jgi:hypothetical protein
VLRKKAKIISNIKERLFMKIKFLASLAVFVSLLVFTGMAQANLQGQPTTLTSTISVDNGFRVYLSTSDNTEGDFVGSANDWYHAYTHTARLTKGVDYYLHVYGYDQGGIAGFLGEFNLSGTNHFFNNNASKLLTNTTDWKANNTGWTATFTTPSDLGQHGIGPWGNISGIDSTAEWIWAGDANNKDEAYFSTKISAAPVPLPAAFPLLFSGLAALGLLRIRFSQ